MNWWFVSFFLYMEQSGVLGQVPCSGFPLYCLCWTASESRERWGLGTRSGDGGLLVAVPGVWVGCRTSLSLGLTPKSMYISEDFPKDEGRCTYNACEQVLGKWCCLLFTIRRICKPLPNTWQCQLKPSTCHLPLQGLSPWPLQSLISNTPWKESKEEIRKEALCVLGKTSRTCLQVVRYFLRQRRFY